MDPDCKFRFSEETSRKRLHYLTTTGELRRVASGVYLPGNLSLKDALLHAPSYFGLLARLCGKDGHISHRTALLMNPLLPEIFIVSPSCRDNQQIILASLKDEAPVVVNVLSPLTTPDTVSVGASYGTDMRKSAIGGALLELTEDRRGRFATAKAPREELEALLLRFFSGVDIQKLQLTHKAHPGLPFITGLLNAAVAGDSEGFASVSARNHLDARGADLPRTKIFKALAEHLSAIKSPQDVSRKWDIWDDAKWDRYSFLSAYFSSYIEGTRFSPGQAEGIVYRGENHGSAPDNRTLAATYLACKSLRGRQRPDPSQDDAHEFFDLLKDLHRELAGGNQSLCPGAFKTSSNFAGAYEFVLPARVMNTLAAGWELAKQIKDPYLSALFLGYVTAEVHPFTDGNGRCSRLVQDLYLLNTGHSGLLITTRSRDLYLEAYRSARKHSEEGPWQAAWLQKLNRLYAAYQQPPLDSMEDTMKFARRENLEESETDGILDVTRDEKGPRNGEDPEI